MKNYKSYILCLFLVSFISLSYEKIYCDDIDIDTINFPNEQPDEFDNFFNESGEINVDKNIMKSCEPGEATIWVEFLNALNIPNLLDIPFYHVTSIPNCSNIINYPTFFIFQPEANQQFSFYTFYNQAFRKNYTKSNTDKLCNNRMYDSNGQRLGAYLNIEDGAILSFLETDLANIRSQLPPSLKPLQNLHFPLVLKTLGNAILEERRLGFIAYFYKQINPKTILELRMPFMYQIHNLNFSAKDKAFLDSQFGEFEKDPDFNEVEFGQKHFIFDAIGSGTLDITLSRTIYEANNYKVNIGAALYLPTDARWASGLYGTYFTPKDIQPILHLCDLVNISEIPPALYQNTTQIVSDYFLAMIDHLSSAILQCPMGYNQHLALALKVVPYWQWKENILYTGMYIFEYLAPHEEPRFYLTKNTVPFSKQFSDIESKGSQAQLDLFQEQLTKTLFPRVFTTKVCPGFILNTISNLQFTRHAWDYTVGYNWWYKTKEKLSNIQVTDDILSELNIKKATAKAASQVKLYGKIHTNFKTKRNGHNISFSLFGTINAWNDNLGDDFLLGISFDKTF